MADEQHPRGAGAPPLRIEDLAPGDPRLAGDVLAVLVELRPHLTAELLAAVYEEGHPQGLRFVAAYEGDRCVGVAGWRIVANTDAVRKLYVDDLVTTSTARSRGVGAALVAELAARGDAAGCHLLDLDSGTQRHEAHRFYLREGFAITSFHFARQIRRGTGDSA